MQIFDSGAAHREVALVPDADGCVILESHRRYFVRADAPLVARGSVLEILPGSGGREGILCLGSYVGLAEIGGTKLRVKHHRLTEAQFEDMLHDVVAETADLAFGYESPAAMPFGRESSAPEEVLYHSLAYLRSAMRRPDGGLVSQFLQVASNPHRRLERELAWTSASRAKTVASQGLLAIASHPELLAPIARNSRLAATGLGRKLSRPGEALFPLEVLAEHRSETFDTHENRLVLDLLRRASEIVRAFEGRELVDPALRADLVAMREEIDWMLSFEFLSRVGAMTLVPSQSTALERREGYRELFEHHVKLGLCSSISWGSDLWHSLLSLKDAARLYEIWSFFNVKRIVDALCGRPVLARLMKTTEESRVVHEQAKVEYEGGIELIYNRRYAVPSSYSMLMRPDVTIRRRRGDAWQALVLDAKLKFDIERLRASDEGEDDPDRVVTRQDVEKMHTYRDAIDEVVGAFVLFPGDKGHRFTAHGATLRLDGVGALPLRPGSPAEDLSNVVAEFLGGLPPT